MVTCSIAPSNRPTRSAAPNAARKPDPERTSPHTGRDVACDCERFVAAFCDRYLAHQPVAQSGPWKERSVLFGK